VCLIRSLACCDCSSGTSRSMLKPAMLVSCPGIRCLSRGTHEGGIGQYLGQLQGASRDGWAPAGPPLAHCNANFNASKCPFLPSFRPIVRGVAASSLPGKQARQTTCIAPPRLQSAILPSETRIFTARAAYHSSNLTTHRCLDYLYHSLPHTSHTRSFAALRLPSRLQPYLSANFTVTCLTYVKTLLSPAPASFAPGYTALLPVVFSSLNFS
jgi:hypothetical protein